MDERFMRPQLLMAFVMTSLSFLGVAPPATHDAGATTKIEKLVKAGYGPSRFIHALLSCN